MNRIVENTYTGIVLIAGSFLSRRDAIVLAGCYILSAVAVYAYVKYIKKSKNKTS